MGGEKRRAKSLRIGVHHANAVVWGPVYRTHLTTRSNTTTSRGGRRSSSKYRNSNHQGSPPPRVSQPPPPRFLARSRTRRRRPRSSRPRRSASSPSAATRRRRRRIRVERRTRVVRCIDRGGGRRTRGRPRRGRARARRARRPGRKGFAGGISRGGESRGAWGGGRGGRRRSRSVGTRRELSIPGTCACDRNDGDARVRRRRARSIASRARGDLERPRTHLDAGCSRGARERGAAARAIPFPGARAGTVRLLAFLGIYGTHRARFPPRGRSVDVRHIALDVDVRVRVRAKNGRPSVPRGFVVRAAA